MQRRDFLKISSAAALGGILPLTGCQRTQNITAIVPFPPGGGGDVLARAVLEPMRREIGQPLVIQNRAGMAGSIGTRQVAKTKEPEHTLGYVTNGILCVNEYLYGKKDLDTITDLIYVGGISRIGLMAVIHPGVVPGVESWETLLDYARRNPGMLAYASSGVGTTSHLAGEMLSMQAGIQLNHIPHAGGAAAMTEVLAGRIPLMIDVMPNALGHVTAGKLKALAVTTPTRSPLAPDIPTMKECGFGDYELFAWDGLAVSHAAPEKFVAKLNTALCDVLKQPEVSARLNRLGAEPFITTPEEFKKFVAEQRPKFQSIAKRIASSISSSNNS